MKPVVQILLKVCSVLFALSLLALYVAHREGKGPFVDKSQSAESNVEFPAIPASPTMFNTSKSGGIVIPAELGSLGTAPYGGNRPITADDIDALIDEAVSSVPKESETEEPGSVVLLPGSKSINMPIFNIKPKNVPETVVEIIPSTKGTVIFREKDVTPEQPDSSD